MTRHMAESTPRPAHAPPIVLHSESVSDHDQLNETAATTGPGDLGTRTIPHPDGAIVLALAGEIDLLTAPAARTAAEQALLLADPAGLAAVLVIDLTEVTFLSSKGMQLLVDTDHAATTRGVELRVATGAHHSVTRPLQIAGLDHALRTFPTRDQALRPAR